MYNVLTLNKIAACGTDLLDKSKYTVSDDEKNPDAIPGYAPLPCMRWSCPGTSSLSQERAQA